MSGRRFWWAVVALLASMAALAGCYWDPYTGYNYPYPPYPYPSYPYGAPPPTNFPAQQPPPAGNAPVQQAPLPPVQ